MAVNEFIVGTIICLLKAGEPATPCVHPLRILSRQASRSRARARTNRRSRFLFLICRKSHESRNSRDGAAPYAPYLRRGAFLSIIETIIARIPLPFKPDKPRLAAGEKENTWRRLGKLFQSAVIMCEFSSRWFLRLTTLLSRMQLFLRCSN